VDRKCAISVGKRRWVGRKSGCLFKREGEREVVRKLEILVYIPIEKEGEKWTLCGQEMEKWTAYLWTGNGEVDCLWTRNEEMDCLVDRKWEISVGKEGEVGQ
jgi:hypothetical protein